MSPFTLLCVPLLSTQPLQHLPPQLWVCLSEQLHITPTLPASLTAEAARTPWAWSGLCSAPR